ncbi:MAG: hypothetical protein AAF066_03930 [Pseudomonadota bacterium]
MIAGVLGFGIVSGLLAAIMALLAGHSILIAFGLYVLTGMFVSLTAMMGCVLCKPLRTGS